jgi:hypothetical protein
VKVNDRLLPVSRQVPEPFTVLPANVAVNVPFGLNSITSLPLHEVVKPPGNGIVAGHSTDCLPVAIDVWRHRPTSGDDSEGKLPPPLVLQPTRNISSRKRPIGIRPKLSPIVRFPSRTWLPCRACFFLTRQLAIANGSNTRMILSGKGLTGAKAPVRHIE